MLERREGQLDDLGVFHRPGAHRLVGLHLGKGGTSSHSVAQLNSDARKGTIGRWGLFTDKGYYKKRNRMGRINIRNKLNKKLKGKL
jgi:hypothetical protein